VSHVDIHEHAQQDLDQLWEGDPAAAASVLVVLEQVSADPRAIDFLTTHGNNRIKTSTVNLNAWEVAKRRFGANLWRMRVLDAPATGYRIIYGYHWQTRQICVFAIVHKDQFDYDDLTSDIARRILADWNAL
jgi:mRNA-degrading endonuclease RelE of RelBE toxin-antitoxin system